VPKHDFEKILLESVDEGLSSLGQSSRLEKIFGSGATFLEIVIMKRLHQKTEEVFELHESTDLAFTEYVTTAKMAFLEKRKAKKILKKLV